MTIFIIISIIKTKYIFDTQVKPFADLHDAIDYFNTLVAKQKKEYKQKFGLGVNVTLHENGSYCNEFTMTSIDNEFINVRIEEHHL